MRFSGLGLRQHVVAIVEKSTVGCSVELGKLAEKMSVYLIQSKSDNTTKKYFASYNRWRSFAQGYGFKELPADPIHVSLFLTLLIDKKSSPCTLDSIIYALKWVHELYGYVDPTNNAYIHSLAQSCKRLNGKPVVKKDPVTSDIILELCKINEFENDLLIVRDLTMILIGYAGFLRFDELSSITCRDVKIFDDHISIFLPRSKTDQYRQGNEILISRGNTLACPVVMYKRYISLASLDVNSDYFIFRPIFRSKGLAKLIYKNKKLSYTATKENIVRRLKTVAPDLNLGLHFLRSGGASAAARSEVNERCIKRHGRWKSDISKNGYIADSLDMRLSVSRKLGL